MQQQTSRTSYNLHEIANMRSMSEQAVLDDIYHGQLKAHVWLFEFGWMSFSSPSP